MVALEVARPHVLRGSSSDLAEWYAEALRSADSLDDDLCAAALELLTSTATPTAQVRAGWLEPLRAVEAALRRSWVVVPSCSRGLCVPRGAVRTARPGPCVGGTYST